MTDETVYAMPASIRKTLDSETYPEAAERIAGEPGNPPISAR